MHIRFWIDWNEHKAIFPDLLSCLEETNLLGLLEEIRIWNSSLSSRRVKEKRAKYLTVRKLSRRVLSFNKLRNRLSKRLDIYLKNTCRFQYWCPLRSHRNNLSLTITSPTTLKWNPHKIQFLKPNTRFHTQPNLLKLSSHEQAQCGSSLIQTNKNLK